VVVGRDDAFRPADGRAAAMADVEMALAVLHHF